MPDFPLKKTLKTSLLAVLALTAIPAQAEKPPVDFSGSLRAQSIFLHDTDIGTANENHSDSQSLDGIGKLTYRANKKLRLQIEGRAVANYGTTSDNDEFNNTATDKDFLELRKLWLEYKSPANIKPVTLSIGRQRIAEDRGIWWNRNIDSAALHYKTETLNGFIATGENIGPHNTAKTDFMQEDEKLFHILSEVSYQWHHNHFIEGRAHLQKDHSGIESVGEIVRASDFDVNDDDLFWTGLRIKGNAPIFPNGIKYSAEVMTVSGETNSLTTIAGAPGSRIVTGANHSNVMGWGFDGNLNIPLNVSAGFTPSILIGYRFGSGDDNSSTDTAFRQSELANNYSKRGYASSSININGSVFHPELQNIHIFTVASSAKIMRASDLTLSYQHYMRNKLSGIGSNGIDAPLSTTGKHLGDGTDIFMNIKLAEELGIENPLLKGVDLRLAIGGFKAGNAYGPNNNNIATRGLFDITAKF